MFVPSHTNTLHTCTKINIHSLLSNPIAHFDVTTYNMEPRKHRRSRLNEYLVPPFVLLSQHLDNPNNSVTPLDASSVRVSRTEERGMTKQVGVGPCPWCSSLGALRVLVRVSTPLGIGPWI